MDFKILAERTIEIEPYEDITISIPLQLIHSYICTPRIVSVVVENAQVNYECSKEILEYLIDVNMKEIRYQAKVFADSCGVYDFVVEFEDYKQEV